MAEGQKR